MNSTTESPLELLAEKIPFQSQAAGGVNPGKGVSTRLAWQIDVPNVVTPIRASSFGRRRGLDEERYSSGHYGKNVSVLSRDCGAARIRYL